MAGRQYPIFVDLMVNLSAACSSLEASTAPPARDVAGFAKSEVLFSNAHVRTMPTRSHDIRSAIRPGEIVPTEIIRLRYAGTCSQCSTPLPAKTQAHWERATKTITCLRCRPAQEDVTEAILESVVGEQGPPSIVKPESGEAGASARAKYERLHRKRDALDKRIGDRAVILNDRKIPRSSANIDHLVVAATGVWIVDAKRYSGRLHRRDKGGWRKVEYHVYVNGRDQTRRGTS